VRADCRETDRFGQDGAHFPSFAGDSGAKGKAMSVTIPHFLLFSESRVAQLAGVGRTENAAGQWRFVCEAADGSSRLEAADEEPDMDPSRLELLAVVRGLESLGQPSHVTLVTPSRYVNRGLRFGLSDWRENDWRWERYGEMIPVKNADLWQRVDRALGIHRVEFRAWRFDAPHVPAGDEPPVLMRPPRRRATSRRRGAKSESNLAVRCLRKVRDLWRRRRSRSGPSRRTKAA
jgi:ribonuclease HI